MSECKIAEIREYNGEKYEAVEDLSCLDCDLETHCYNCDDTQWIDRFGHCGFMLRDDGKNIGWRLVK